MPHGFRRLMGLGAAILCLAFGPAPAGAATPDDASAFVGKLVDKAINSVIGADMPRDQKAQRFREMFVDSADIPGICAFVVGREWRAASPQQKAEFTNLFEEVSILTWISHLDEYRDVKVEITGAYADKADLFVESQAKTKDGKPIPIVWRLQERGAKGLKLIDVVIEANSMLINTRKQYAAVMQRDGGLPGLMAALQKMRTELNTPSP